MKKLTTPLSTTNIFKNYVDLISKEVHRAETKFPDFASSLAEAALVVSEEAGEVSRAVLQHLQEGGSIDAIKTEIIQTAGVCLRLLAYIDEYYAQSNPCLIINCPHPAISDSVYCKHHTE